MTQDTHYHLPKPEPYQRQGSVNREHKTIMDTTTPPPSGSLQPLVGLLKASIPREANLENSTLTLHADGSGNVSSGGARLYSFDDLEGLQILVSLVSTDKPNKELAD